MTLFNVETGKITTLKGRERIIFDLKEGLGREKYNPIIDRLIMELPDKMIPGCLITLLVVNPEIRKIYGRQGQSEEEFINDMMNIAKEIKNIGA